MNIFGLFKKSTAQEIKTDKTEEIEEILQDEFGDWINDVNITITEDWLSISGFCNSSKTREKVISTLHQFDPVIKINDENLLAPDENFMKTFS